jgi:hypothetical protein
MTNTAILIVVAILAVLVVAFLALRGRGGAPRVERRPEGESPYVASQERPYMKAPAGTDGPQGNSVVDEVAVATTDVAGEVERLDESLGAFRGRLTRDRVVEQADYLARGDIDGFEEKFGKLG